MGMYTEILVTANLKQNVQNQVVEIIKHMIGTNRTDMPPLPKHPLFDSDRWDMLFCCTSYYFPGETVSRFRFDDISNQWHLTARANLKNYGGEIELFMDWIAPHIDTQPGDFVGLSRYEETEWPTLWHVSDDGRIVPTVTEPRESSDAR